MTAELKKIETKVGRGERLSPDDAMIMFESDDLLAIGELAASVNHRRNGDQVYFNVNRHINYTNICVNQCTFCAFHRKSEDQDGSYTLALQEIQQRAQQASESGATEIHMVGGLHPELPFDFYPQMLKTIKAADPALHIKAFTAVEIDYFAKLTNLPVSDLVSTLRQAGLDSLPGGGAEIFAPAVRQQICPEKISGERWLEIMETVHRIGLKTNATMLFGHIESFQDRVDHLTRLRDLQDRTGGFQAFIPLPFQPENSKLMNARGAGGVDSLKTLAISRLYLDNFRHLKAYWVMLGLKVAQVALCFGVNDLDGTVVEEKIGHEAGATSPQELGRAQLVALIRAAGKIAVERDTLYRTVRAG
ncbi:MAG: aminofutalosine synthase MqnE [Deltaproteobacteria bacterium]|jgi:aminodeoxyfutalosine synthase|nr:aminofutalosine synthase MqnE [Deltaproteobacteria bacterium]MBW2519806.1 aminofutalosine synthase MqnE [Deltaproteobacteria bacterium]